jgi:Na+/melibiose symporter-like transporter
MIRLFNSATRGLADSFRQVQGNARVILLFQPAWALTNNLYMPFLSLYMNRVGCSLEQVGIINVVSMLAGAFLAPFAGWITDRLGRRNTDLFSDTMCWVVACLLWGLGGSFVWFLLAGVANAFVRIIAVSWNCTLAEGTPPENRISVFWWLGIVNNMGVFATPIMGLLIAPDDPQSLIGVMRTVLLGSSAALLAAFIGRHLLLRELPIGRERMEIARRQSPLDALKAYLPMFRLLRGNRTLLVLLIVRSVYYVQLGLKATFQGVAVVDGLGFPDGMIGIMSLITGAVMILSQLVALSRMQRLPAKATLMVGMAALLLSNAMLVVSPAGNTPLLMISTVLMALGTMVTALMADSTAANAMPDGDRAQLMGFMTVLMVVLSAPLMWLGGWLAELPQIGPRLPLLMIAVLTAGAMALLATVRVPFGREVEEPGARIQESE